MSKVHIELSMDKKQILVAFLQDVDGNMDTYRKHVQIRNAFDLEIFELFIDDWRAELRMLNGIVVGSRIDILITVRNIRYQTYRDLLDVKDEKSGETHLPSRLRRHQGIAERTGYDVSLEMLKVLQGDMKTKDWSKRRTVNERGKIETVDRIVNMDEAQVIVELDDLLTDVINVKEESDG